MLTVYRLGIGLDGRFSIRPVNVAKLTERVVVLADGQRVPTRSADISYYPNPDAARSAAIDQTSRRLRIARRSLETAERAHNQAMEL